MNFLLTAAGEFGPPTAANRQGGMDARRGQSRRSALRLNHRHLAQTCRDRRSISLRGDLLRPRRYGEPDQGVPTRLVRRPHLGRHHARQPAPPLVRLHGLSPSLAIRIRPRPRIAQKRRRLTRHRHLKPPSSPNHAAKPGVGRAHTINADTARIAAPDTFDRQNRRANRHVRNPREKNGLELS